MRITPEINELIYKIAGICSRVHNTLGPGFPEDFYKKAFGYELGKSNFRYESHKKIQIMYEEVVLGEDFLDFIVDDLVVVAIKSEKTLTEVHRMKVMKSFQWTEYPAALLVNFGESELKYERVLPPVEIHTEK